MARILLPSSSGATPVEVLPESRAPRQGAQSIPTAQTFGQRPAIQEAPGIRIPHQDVSSGLKDLGRAVQGIGSKLADFAEHDRRDQEQREQFDRQTDWMAFQTAIDRNYEQAGQQAIDDNNGAPGFANDQLNQFDVSANDFMQSLGPTARPEDVRRWQTKLDQKRYSLEGASVDFQRTQQDTYYLTRLQNQLDQTLINVNSHPDSYGTYSTELWETVKSSGLSATAKRAFFEKVPSLILGASVKSLQDQNRYEEALQLLQDYQDASYAIGNHTDGNHPIVQAMQKTGIKIGDEHWLDMLEQYRPDLAEAHKDDEQSQLALRDNPELVSELLASNAEQAGAVLRENGISPTPANLLIANIFGVDADHGALAILSQPDETPLSTVLTAEQYQEGKDAYQGRDVGWLKEQSAMLMHGPASDGKLNAESRFLVGPQAILKLRDDTIKSQQTFFNSVGNQRFGQYQLAIADDPLNVTRDQIRSDASLKPSQKATLLDSLASHQRAAQKLQGQVDLVANSPGLLDPTIKANRDAVDVSFAAQAQHLARSAEQDDTQLDPEQLLQLGTSITNQTGIAPASLVSNVRVGLLSGDPQQFAQSSALAAELYKASPTAFMSQSNAKFLADAATDWDLYLNYYRLSPAQATQILMPIYDPANAKDEEILASRAAQAVKDMTAQTAFDDFNKYALHHNEGWVSWAYHKLPFTGSAFQIGGEALGDRSGEVAEQDAFLSDYTRLYKANFVAAKGNEDLAKARASAQLLRLWGPTELGPPGATIIRNPIELSYPQIAPEFLRAAMVDQVEQSFGFDQPDPDKVFLLASPQTRQDLATGNEPEYLLFVRRTDKVTGQEFMDTLPGNNTFRPPAKDSDEWRRILTPEQYQQFVKSPEETFREGQFEQLQGFRGMSREDFLVTDTHNASQIKDVLQDIADGLETRANPNFYKLGRGLPPLEQVAYQLPRVDLVSVLNGSVSKEQLREDLSQPFHKGNSVADKIIRIESGGRANSKNPRSSATGAGQFISSTWTRMLRQYRPDLAKGRSKAEILALRNNPQLSKEMVQHYIQENTATLRRNHLDTSPGNLYLAHFLGPQGAVAVLKASPLTPLRAVLSTNVMKANTHLRGKNVAFIKRWAANKMKL